MRRDEQHDHEDAHDGDGKTDDEQQIEVVGCASEQQEGNDRSDHRASGVERPVDAERRRELSALTPLRDQRVAWRGADALADAIRHGDPGDAAPRRTGRKDQKAAGGRQRIPGTAIAL